ncbi:MAG: polymer-forming cytoskeletal protein [Chthoniobacterales bacterium]|nr:polymer-forming cytoskeletal protein [Chthoniobacterales bacterium]
MPPRIAKQAVTCPECGATQQESPGVISTFCRSCGQHFELAGKPPAPAVAARTWAARLAPLAARLEPLKKRALKAAEPWLLRYEPQIGKLREYYERWRPPEFKRVRCHECGRIHEVPRLASSTSCPNCNAHIDLYDVIVEKRMSRVVRTRGNLVIKKFGYLNNQLTICGNADIGGGAAGKIFCDGETKISTTGRLNCEIGSRRVRVEKGADVIIAHPIRVHDMVVRGKLTARIYCNGTLRILKRGFLRGEVHARSITVDKGGLLQAELNIGRFDEQDPEILGTLQERACYMALEEAAPAPQQASLQI